MNSDQHIEKLSDLFCEILSTSSQKCSFAFLFVVWCLNVERWYWSGIWELPVIIHDIDIDAGISILLNIEHPDKRNILHKHNLIYIGNGKVVSFSGCYQLLSTQMSLTIQNITTKPNGLLDVYMLINCWIKIFLKMSGKSFTEGDILSVMTKNLWVFWVYTVQALFCCIVLQLVAFFPWPAFARIQLTHLPQNWFHRHWSPQEFATSPQEPRYKQVDWITPLPSKMYG